jgi:hypothetical protein
MLYFGFIQGLRRREGKTLAILVRGDRLIVNYAVKIAVFEPFPAEALTAK